MCIPHTSAELHVKLQRRVQGVVDSTQKPKLSLTGYKESHLGNASPISQGEFVLLIGDHKCSHNNHAVELSKHIDYQRI